MKTFFAFTTGLLGGIAMGAFGLATMMVASKDLREFADDVANQL